MGWNTANEIFDTVAQELIEAGATFEVKKRVASKLIRSLQGQDWDTEDESLEEFKDDRAIVEAFGENGIEV